MLTVRHIDGCKHETIQEANKVLYCPDGFLSPDTPGVIFDNRFTNARPYLMVINGDVRFVHQTGNAYVMNGDGATVAAYSLD